MQQDDEWITQGAKYTLGTAAHALEAVIALVELVLTGVVLVPATALHFLIPGERENWFDEKIFIPMAKYAVDATVAMCAASSRIVTNFTETSQAVEESLRSRLTSVFLSETSQKLKPVAQDMKSQDVQDRIGTLRLFGYLVATKDARVWPLTRAAASQGMESQDPRERDWAIVVFMCLIRHGDTQSHEAARAAAATGMQNPGTQNEDIQERCSALTLFRCLIQRGDTQSHEAARSAAVKGMENSSETERTEASALWAQLPAAGSNSRCGRFC